MVSRKYLEEMIQMNHATHAHEANVVLTQALKNLLSKQRFSSQRQLALALKAQGFAHISQSKVSRLIDKVGAVKVRNSLEGTAYSLPDKRCPLDISREINELVITVQHNQAQVVIKTRKSGAKIIAQIIESMAEQYGVMACIAADNSVLVIPNDVHQVAEVCHALKEHFSD